MKEAPAPAPTETRVLDDVFTGIDELTVTAHGGPSAGGAPREYSVSMQRVDRSTQTLAVLRFQDGDPAKEINGITNEALFAVAIDRYEQWQQGPCACEENKEVLDALYSAMRVLQSRKRERIERGVLGKTEA